MRSDHLVLRRRDNVAPYKDAVVPGQSTDDHDGHMQASIVTLGNQGEHAFILGA